MLNLNKEETLNIYEDYIGFYDEFADIETYYRYKKRKRLEGLPSSLSLFGLGPEDDLFNSPELAPEDMEFEIVHTSDKPAGGKLLTKDYTTLLELTASFNADNSPGRSSRFGIREKNTEKFVGFIKLGSPVINIKPRNVYFQCKQTPLKIANKHFVNGFNIVPSQPFGFNCLGGKLIALICVCHELREFVNNKYDEMEALFFETTSLYGSIKNMSQYDGLKPYIRHKGNTESKLLLNLSDEVYKKTREFLEEKNDGKPLVQDDQAIPTSRKFRTQGKILSILKEHLKKYDIEKYNNLLKIVKEKMAITTQKRYYISDYGYENTKDYIFGNTDKLIKKPNFDNYYFDNVVNWWKKKAQKRWENVKADGRLRNDLEFWTLDNIDKDSFVKFFSDLVRELNKTRDDLIWHVPLTAYSRLLNIPNVVQYTNLRLPTYPNSMRGYFDHRAWLKIVDWKYKDFDFVFSQLPEWTVNISNFLSNATHFGVLPIIGYCHWTETKEFAKYARTYLSYNLQGTLEMLECGLNTQTQIRNIINNEASQWFNSKTIKKLSSIMKPHYIGVNDEDIAKDICKEPNKTIVFNHRLNNYRNYPFFLEAVRDLRKLRQDFTVWCSLADKKDEEYFDIEGVSLKEPYLAKLNKSYLGILCGNRWAISAQDGMAQGLPYLYEDSEENAELFGGLDSPLNMSGKFKTKDDLVSLMNHYLNDLDDRNMFATATLNYSKEVMAWSNRIKSYNDMINKATTGLTSVTEKSEAIKKILTFIDRHGKVTKNEIMKHIGWGVGITFSPYRQYLRNHPTIELEWDGQTEYYCYKDDDGITS